MYAIYVRLDNQNPTYFVAPNANSEQVNGILDSN